MWMHPYFPFGVQPPPTEPHSKCSVHRFHNRRQHSQGSLSPVSTKSLASTETKHNKHLWPNRIFCHNSSMRARLPIMGAPRQTKGQFRVFSVDIDVTPSRLPYCWESVRRVVLLGWPGRGLCQPLRDIRHCPAVPMHVTRSSRHSKSIVTSREHPVRTTDSTCAVFKSPFRKSQHYIKAGFHCRAWWSKQQEKKNSNK